MYEQIEAIIREAGRMILSAHLNNNNIHQKTGPANFVTDYDVRIQRFLIEKLGALVPGCGFFGEEDTEGNKRRVEGHTFFIDPIDGVDSIAIFGILSIPIFRIGKDMVFTPFGKRYFLNVIEFSGLSVTG